MEIIELLEHPDIIQIVKQQEEVNRQEALAGYNLLTISTYTAHLENFHSDVIASLLNPEGLHGEGYTFLHLFIEYLNRNYDLNIDKNKYLHAIVLREKGDLNTGRIDIWIKDEASKESIIIENKINDATHREGQLKDYYSYAINNGYTVNAIIYLSNDGRKLAPYDGEIVKDLTINIAAFNNTISDLYKGWLKPCLANSHNEDSKSFIHQYTKLIAHMGNKDMTNEIKESFYKFVSKHHAFETVMSINQLITLLPAYRAQRFADKTENYLKTSPFQYRFKYQNNYYIFEKYVNANGSYKLDVCFESNGNAFVVLWNTTKPNSSGYETVKEILTRTGLIGQFTAESRYNGLTAEFSIAKYLSLEEIDNSVLALVNDVFNKLNALVQQPAA